MCESQNTHVHPAFHSLANNRRVFERETNAVVNAGLANGNTKPPYRTHRLFSLIRRSVAETHQLLSIEVAFKYLYHQMLASADLDSQNPNAQMAYISLGWMLNPSSIARTAIELAPASLQYGISYLQKHQHLASHVNPTSSNAHRHRT